MPRAFQTYTADAVALTEFMVAVAAVKDEAVMGHDSTKSDSDVVAVAGFVA